MAYLRLLRPEQWIKNVFLFAGLIFGRRLDHPDGAYYAEISLLGFFIFCLLSSGVYVFNDIHDRDEDRLHPRKRLRPIARGQVSVTAAMLLSAACIGMGLAGAVLLDRGFCVVSIAYVLLQITYTLALKHTVLLDVISLGLGFVLRAIAGAVLVHVVISHWLVICTFTLCLFLGFSKRRCELNALANGANPDGQPGRHRRTLAHYTPDLLNHMTTLAAGIAVVSFLLYATDRRTLDEFGTNYLVYTLPIVVYAIFRFALLVEHERVDGPTDVILRDRPFQAAILLWTVAAVAIVYRGPAIREWLTSILGRAN
jgi:4-hydroxybenzoate polyprenyltransferase